MPSLIYFKRKIVDSSSVKIFSFNRSSRLAGIFNSNFISVKLTLSTELSGKISSTSNPIRFKVSTKLLRVTFVTALFYLSAVENIPL